MEFSRICVFVSLQSSVCGKIMELLGQNKIDHHQRQVAILSQDSFYKVLTPEQKAKALKGQFNFDHPGRCSRRTPKSPTVPAMFVGLFIRWCLRHRMIVVGGCVRDMRYSSLWEDHVGKK